MRDLRDFWIGLVLGIVLGLAVERSYAQSEALLPKPPTMERATELYILAYSRYTERHPGFKLPERAPTVDITTTGYLAQRWGLGHTVKAVTDSDGVIHLVNDVDTWEVLGASILFHEYIHYFQWIAAGRPRDQTCEEALDREREAYTMQGKELERVGEWMGAQYVFYNMAALGHCLEVNHE